MNTGKLKSKQLFYKRLDFYNMGSTDKISFTVYTINF